MIERKVALHLPDLSEAEVVQKSMELCDDYLTQKRWLSHQSVFKAVADVYQISYPCELLRLLTGFSAGGGFSGHLCGALCGGIAILSYIYGSEEPMSEEVYALFVETIVAEDISPEEKADRFIKNLLPGSAVYNVLVLQFKNKYGDCNCFELLSPFSEDPISRRRFGSCRRIVRETAGLTARLILEIEKGAKEPVMGENIYSHLIK